MVRSPKKGRLFRVTATPVREVQQFEATLKIDENWQKKCKGSKELKDPLL